MTTPTRRYPSATWRLLLEEHPRTGAENMAVDEAVMEAVAAMLLILAEVAEEEVVELAAGTRPVALESTRRVRWRLRCNRRRGGLRSGSVRMVVVESGRRGGSERSKESIYVVIAVVVEAKEEVVVATGGLTSSSRRS